MELMHEKPETLPEATKLTGRNVVTNSSMNCFKQCRRKFYYKYELGWRSGVEKTPLRIGRMVHFGLDLLAQDKTIPEVLVSIREQYENAIAALSSSYDDDPRMLALAYECETVLILLTGYIEAWQNSGIVVLESEQTFTLPIMNPDTNYPARIFGQAGKRDRICRLPDTRIALMETKTSSEDIGPDSEYRHVLVLNQQISMYVLAAKEEGKNIETTLYDCIRKPTIRPSQVALTDIDNLKIVLDSEGERVLKKDGAPRQTGDTAKGYVLQSRPMTPEEWAEKLKADIEVRPAFYFQRFEVSRLEKDLDEFRHELWDISQDIHHCRKNNLWYRNISNCRAYHNMCTYYQLCAGEIDTSYGCPGGFRQVENVHEELEDENGNQHEER